jgi:hypothetical protein
VGKVQHWAATLFVFGFVPAVLLWLSYVEDSRYKICYRLSTLRAENIW